MLTRFSLREQAITGALLVLALEAASTLLLHRRTRQMELELSSQEAVVAANAASATMTVIVRDIKTLLSAASRLDAVRSGRTDAAGCKNALLQAMELGVNDALVTNIFVLDPAGVVECHTGDPSAVFKQPNLRWPELSHTIAAGTVLNAAGPFFGISHEWVALLGCRPPMAECWRPLSISPS